MRWLRKLFRRGDRPTKPAINSAQQAAPPPNEAQNTEEPLSAPETAQSLFEHLPHGEKQRVQEIVQTILTHIRRDVDIPSFHVNDSFSVDARDCLVAFAHEYGLVAKWNSEAGNTISFLRSTR